jgi:hypothetical protein
MGSIANKLLPAYLMADLAGKFVVFSKDTAPMDFRMA